MLISIRCLYKHQRFKIFMKNGKYQFNKIINIDINNDVFYNRKKLTLLSNINNDIYISNIG